MDNFVEMVIKALRDDVFRHEFGIQGQVTFYDREPIGNFAEEQLGANESSGRANTPTTREP